MKPSLQPTCLYSEIVFGQENDPQSWCIMPYKIVYDKEGDYILISVEGDFGLPILKDMAEDVASVIEQHGCNRILNDMRRAKFTAGTIDIYNMPKTARTSGIGMHCKRALVTSEQSSDFHFLETVFLNQGHNVKIFTDIEEAMSWLLD